MGCHRAKNHRTVHHQNAQFTHHRSSGRNSSISLSSIASPLPISKSGVPRTSMSIALSVREVEAWVTNLCAELRYCLLLTKAHQPPLEAHNYHLQTVLMFAKSRHLRPSYCPALAETQNSLLTYLRGFPLGQCRNSQMMAEARGFPDCSGGFHSHSSLSWCEPSSDSVPCSNLPWDGWIFGLDRQSGAKMASCASWVISFQIRGASAI